MTIPRPQPKDGAAPSISPPGTRAAPSADSFLTPSLDFALGESRDFRSALEVLLARLCSAAGWDFGEAWVPSWDRAALEPAGSWYIRSHDQEPLRREREALTLEPGEGLPGLAWSSRKPVWVEDLQEDQRKLGGASDRDAGFRCAVAAPILSGREVVAVLALSSGVPRKLDPASLASLGIAASSLGPVLQRKRADEMILEGLSLSKLNSEIALALTRADTLRGMLERCTQSIVRNLDAAFARIWTYNEATRTLELQASSGIYTHLDGPHSRVPLGKLKIGLIALEREPHRTNLVIGDPRVGDQEWARREGMVAFAGYPLVLEERRLGVVAMFARRPLSAFTFKTLGSVADAIALGIERKRGELELRSRTREQEALANLSQEALATTDLSRLIEETIGSVSVTLDVEYCDVLELLDDGETLRMSAGAGWREERIRDYRTSLATSPAGEVIRTGGPLILEDLNAESRFADLRLQAEHGVSSSLQVRIPDEKGAFGVLGVHSTARRAFTPDDVRFLQAVANVMAAAIQRQRSEEEHLLLSSAVSQAAESIMVTRPDGVIVYVNPVFERITGYSPQEAIGRTPRLLKSGKYDGKFYERMWGAVLSGKVWQGEVVNRRKDGTLYAAQLDITPVRNERGEITHFICFSQDITERKSLELQLAQSQKLESIGQLAAGIAHEINTPIQYVGDNTSFLLGAFGDLQKVLAAYGRLAAAARGGTLSPGLLDEVQAEIRAADIEYLTAEIPKAIGQSLEGVSRVAKIVRAMKEFSHPGGEEKKATDINHAIENTITVARNEWKYVAEMVTDLDQGLPLVPCLPGEFNQVILNLIVNAAHAIGDVVNAGRAQKGTIRISTRRHGPVVEVRVQDTGTGIPEAVRPRIFDPFFTTKPVGRGTGQGLSIARSVIVKKHGGTLEFETETGKGTTFIVRLPLSETCELARVE